MRLGCARSASGGDAPFFRREGSECGVPSPAGPTFGGAVGDAEGLRDLRVGETLRVPEDERRPVLCPHAAQGRPQLLAALQVQGRRLGVGARGRRGRVGVREAVLACAPARLLPSVAQTGVCGDPVEPGLEGAISPEAAYVAPYQDPDLLARVLGVVRSHQPRCDPAHKAGLGPDQAIEGPEIAPGGAPGVRSGHRLREDLRRRPAFGGVVFFRRRLHRPAERGGPASSSSRQIGPPGFPRSDAGSWPRRGAPALGSGRGAGSLGTSPSQGKDAWRASPAEARTRRLPPFVSPRPLPQPIGGIPHPSTAPGGPVRGGGSRPPESPQAEKLARACHDGVARDKRPGLSRRQAASSPAQEESMKVTPERSTSVGPELCKAPRASRSSPRTPRSNSPRSSNREPLRRIRPISTPISSPSGPSLGPRFVCPSPAAGAPAVSAPAGGATPPTLASLFFGHALSSFFVGVVMLARAALPPAIRAPRSLAGSGGRAGRLPAPVPPPAARLGPR